MSGGLHKFILPDVRGTKNPVLPRGTLIKAIVDQVNRNTIQLAPPRQVLDRTYMELDGETIEDTDGAVTDAGDADATAISKIWVEVSKSYEDVEVDGVTIRRRVTSIFSSGGTRELFVFNNDDLT